MQYFDLDSGHVLFSDISEGAWCLYRVGDGEVADTIAGSYPAAYFDRFTPPLS